jgi:hypothetical protein
MKKLGTMLKLLNYLHMQISVSSTSVYDDVWCRCYAPTFLVTPLPQEGH